MQYDLALSCYEKAALERPLYAEAYCNMGVIYKNRGDLEAAIACYERFADYYFPTPIYSLLLNQFERICYWWLILFTFLYIRCLTVSPNFEIAKNNMAIALTDLGTKVRWIENKLKKKTFFNFYATCIIFLQVSLNLEAPLHIYYEILTQILLFLWMYHCSG